MDGELPGIVDLSSRHLLADRMPRSSGPSDVWVVGAAGVILHR